MKFIADFHIHSPYSRATSSKLIPENLDYWAKIKGIDVMGTGDCLHPQWLKELKTKLEPGKNGLFKLKKEFLVPGLRHQTESISFLLTTEISTIYKKLGRVRKVHQVLVFPSFEVAENFAAVLGKIGNLVSDGRPILGLDSKHLLEMLLEASPDAYFIPAHIWTPWFSLFGANSGFDSIKDCFEDLSSHIFALETGLSSDPAMNRLVSELDNFRLVSNSDAHSLENIGREANLFETDLTYEGILNALKLDQGFLGTIEFFPEEGKYHYDGHRNCEVVFNPLESIEHENLCPVCHKPVTKGVMHRVAELADRAEQEINYGKQSYQTITPLKNLLAEIAETSAATKKVNLEYFKLIEKFGSEFDILLNVSLSDLASTNNPLIIEGIKRLRNREVELHPGFDGEFGRILVFDKSEIKSLKANSLFSFAEQLKPRERIKTIEFDVNAFKRLREENPEIEAAPETVKPSTFLVSTNAEANSLSQNFVSQVIIAGPGSGKTTALTQAVVDLITKSNILPENILALTFSNQAAAEMKLRIEQQLKGSFPNSYTFHALGYLLLKEYAEKFERTQDFLLIDQEKEAIVSQFLSKKADVKKFIKDLENYKNGVLKSVSDSFHAAYKKYTEELVKRNAFDLEDLIYLPCELFGFEPSIQASFQRCFTHILIDEFQDLNPKQYELFRFLVSDYLFAIGDPDQAIYGFRGADKNLLVKIKQDFSKITEKCLTTSYRCPEAVLKLGAQILQSKNMMAGKKDTSKPKLTAFPNENYEAEFIASTIEKMIGATNSFSLNANQTDGTSYDGINSFSDIGILARSNFMFEPVIKALRNHGISYQLNQTQPFYRLQPFVNFLQVLKQIFFAEFIDIYAEIPESFINETKLSFVNQETLKNLFLKQEKILKEVFKFSRTDLNKLLTLVAPYEHHYALFFQELELRINETDFAYPKEAVSFLTLHAAKGLEFEAVFILGLEDNLLPFEVYGPKNDHEISEEARLFYVGLTRVKRYLNLSYARKRIFNNRVLIQKPSRFLKLMDKALIDFEDIFLAKQDFQLDLFS